MSIIAGDPIAESHKTSKMPIVAGTVGGILGLIFVIAVLAVFCAFLKKRREKKEDEKRMLGYYVPPGARFIEQEIGNGMFYLTSYGLQGLISCNRGGVKLSHEEHPSLQTA